MKKSLFLLPLLGGFVLTGCTITIGGKTLTFFEKNASGNETEKGTGTGTGNQQSSSSGLGTALATVTLTGCQDAVDKEASPLVFTKDGYSVEVANGSASTKLPDAVKNTKTYEFRVYNGMNITFSGPQAFSKLFIKYSTYVSNGTTYYFDFDLSGATNANDDTKGEAIVTLDSASTSYSIEKVGHQTRIASVSFYA